MDSTFRLETTITVFRVTTFRSPFLKSRYHLAYIQSNMSMLGALTPFTCFFREVPGSHKLVPLGGRKVTVGDFVVTSGRVDLDWSAEIRDVTKDCRTETLGDSAEALRAAIDMVSVVSPDRPTVLISGIYDVYEFSNSVAGDLLWDQAATADTIPKH
jgi:hypothetical protein